jgi:hypothetical protein
MGLGTEYHCAGEGLHQFSSQSVLSCIVSGCYLATTSEQTEDFLCALVVVIYKVYKSVRLLQLFVVMSYKCSVNPIINPNSVTNHRHVTVPWKMNSYITEKDGKGVK